MALPLFYGPGGLKRCDVGEDQRVLGLPAQFHQPKVNTGNAGGHYGTLAKACHIYKLDQADSVEDFTSILSFSEFSYLKFDHYSQADRFGMVPYATDHAGFHPHWF